VVIGRAAPLRVGNNAVIIRVPSHVIILRKLNGCHRQRRRHLHARLLVSDPDVPFLSFSLRVLSPPKLEPHLKPPIFGTAAGTNRNFARGSNGEICWFLGRGCAPVRPWHSREKSIPNRLLALGAMRSSALTPTSAWPTPSSPPHSRHRLT